MHQDNDIVTITIRRLRETFGPPDTSTVAVTRWRLSDRYGVTVMHNQHKATVWTPWRDGISSDAPPFSSREAGSRHSNTYQCPGLEEGSPGLKSVIRHPEDLDALIGRIQQERHRF